MIDLSVVIPTRNRYEYCKFAVDSILNLKSNRYNVEVIVQDNSDNNQLCNYFKTKNDNRIKYNYHSGVISFVDNFDEALSFVSGKYVIMIGDDDAVLPSIFNAIEYMINNNVDCLLPTYSAIYCWPMENPFIKNAENGYMCLTSIKNKYQKIDVIKSLCKTLNDGGQNYQNNDMPRLYHGLVKVEILNEIKQKLGHNFGGLTPDIYNATTMCFVCKNVVKAGYPITISGICNGSGSSNSATGKHTGELKDAPHFVGHNNYNWIDFAPRIYSVESIWGETMLHAIEDFNKDEFLQKFNIKALDTICFDKYPQYSNIIILHAKKYGISKLTLKIDSFLKKISKFVLKALKKAFRPIGSVKKIYNIKNIDKACAIVVEELNKKI